MDSEKNKWNIASLQLLKRCLAYFMPYKWSIGFAFFSMAVVAGCTAGSAWLIKPFMDGGLIDKDTEKLKWTALAFVCIMLLKCFFRFFQVYLMNAAGLRVLETLRNDLFDKIVRLPMRFFEKSQVGMLMSRILNDVLQLRESMPSFVMLIREVLTMFALIGTVIYIDPYMAMWALLVLPLALYPFIYFGRKLRKYGRRNQVKLSDINSLLQEHFSGIKVIKAFANEKGAAREFRLENARLLAILLKQCLVSELSSRFMELVGAFGVGLVVWFGGMQVVDGRVTPGELATFMAALVMLYEPIKKITTSNNNIQRALAGAERVFEILDAPHIQVEQSGDHPFELPFKLLEIEGVGFSYSEDGASALADITLSIRAGERVALVGPSGAGKTTLVNLIPRFYDPTMGEIRINGRPVREYDLADLRRNMAMVSQDTFLFNTTVRDNIAYGAEVVAEAVELAAETAYAHGFVRELDTGYDSVVGERGVKLSGGQKQRLTIARALYKNPPLLILDEATSALDTESERIVQMALENLMKDRTSIVIAHRLSTVLNADRIVVMEKGRIVAQGRHKDLLKVSPLYARLYRMQFTDHMPDQENEGE